MLLTEHEEIEALGAWERAVSDGFLTNYAMSAPDRLEAEQQRLWAAIRSSPNFDAGAHRRQKTADKAAIDAHLASLDAFAARNAELFPMTGG